MKQEVVAGRDANVAGRDLTIINNYGPGSQGRHGDFTVVPAAEAFRLEEFPCETSACQVDPQRSGLSALLRAASRVVPFIGRTTELSQLQSWRDAPGRLSVILVFGPGGQGKTRLASEFAGDSEMAGWAVAQARHQSDPQPRLPSAGNPREDQAGVLVVVDYAERWPRLELEQLLQHRLLSRAGRARVLLLARPAGYWWKALANPLVKLGATVAELPLGPLADSVAQRKTAFTAARDRFAEILGVADTSRLQPAGSLADDAYELALTLHMAALVAVDAHRRKSSAPDKPSELSSYLLQREYDHWQTMGDNRRISTSPRTMARLVALATLTQSLSHRDATDLLLSIGLAGDRAEAQSLLDDYGSCYPATGDFGKVLEPLRPDRLGEDFIADLLPDPDLGPAHGDPWMAGIPAQLLTPPAGAALPGYSPAVLSVLVETGRRWEHVRQRYLVPLLLERPKLALAAGGAPLVTLAGYGDLELLTALQAILPKQRHVELDSGIAALTQRLTDYGLAQTTDDAKRAQLYDELAGRLSNGGLYRDALSATQEAIVIRRRLAQADPAKHEPMLANSLGNLGIDLWTLGLSAQALDAMTEAVRVYRRRAGRRTMTAANRNESNRGNGQREATGLSGLGRPAVAGHRAEQAGHHVERGHAKPLDDRHRRGVALVDLRRAIEPEPPHTRRAPVSLQRGVIFRRHRAQHETFGGQVVVHGGHPTDRRPGASFHRITMVNR